MSDAPVRFTDDDLAAFAAASRDVNPLHRDPAFARATAFGAPVVYGALGALAALGRLAPRAGQHLVRLQAEFAAPMFVGVDYTAEVEDGGTGRAKVRLRDGRRVVLRLSARFAEGPCTPTPLDDALHGLTEPSTADDPSPDSLVPGATRQGRYAPRVEALSALHQRFGLDARGVAPHQSAALAGCSYLVGMRLPGRRALFSDLTLDGDAPAPDDTPGAYTLRLDALHDDFGLATLSAKFAAPLAARAKLTAFVRPSAPAVKVDAARAQADALLGRVAVVTGASRGLGAALAVALAREGCTVVGTFLHSAKESDALAAALAATGGRFEPWRSDATSPEDVAALVAGVSARHGGVDLLVCNACPPLRPLWLDAASVARVVAHVTESVAMVATPLAHLLPALETRKGTVLVVSSSALDAPPAEWPHYVAAKHAVEGLAETAAREHPAVTVWVARPPKLLTELVNTPMGRQGAADPGDYAAALVRAMVAGEADPANGLRRVSAPTSEG